MFRFTWIAIVVVILDQASKLAAIAYLVHYPEIRVTPFFNLTLVYNAGAAFGFLSGASGWQNMLFIVIALVACIFILFMVRRLGASDVQMMTGLMLVLGGAIGNLIDRLRFGYVIDFIDLYYRAWHWPAFNIADSAITVGAVLLVLDAVGMSFGKRHA